LFSRVFLAWLPDALTPRPARFSARFSTWEDSGSLPARVLALVFLGGRIARHP